MQKSSVLNNGNNNSGGKKYINKYSVCSTNFYLREEIGVKLE